MFIYSLTQKTSPRNIFGSEACVGSRFQAFQAMSVDLRDLWLGGPDDRLCAREQAKACALREIWMESKTSTCGLNEFVASRLCKNKNGAPVGDRPSSAAMKEFFAKIADKEWYPGKQSGAKRGPERVLTGAKKAAAVRAARMIQKEEEEVTYAHVVSSAEKTVLNPATGEPVSPSLI